MEYPVRDPRIGIHLSGQEKRICDCSPTPLPNADQGGTAKKKQNMSKLYAVNGKI